MPFKLGLSVKAEEEAEESVPQEEPAAEEEPAEEAAAEEEEEEELVDPLEHFRETALASNAKCQKLFAEFETCEARVKSRTNTEEKCSQEMFDYKHCVDHIVFEKAFKQLK